MKVLQRIIGSRKSVLAMVPVVSNAIASMAGIDLQGIPMLVVDFAFAGLVIAQTIIDAVHGSPSDAIGSE